MFQLIAEN